MKTKPYTIATFLSPEDFAFLRKEVLEQYGKEIRIVLVKHSLFVSISAVLDIPADAEIYDSIDHQIEGPQDYIEYTIPVARKPAPKPEFDVVCCGFTFTPQGGREAFVIVKPRPAPRYVTVTFSKLR